MRAFVNADLSCDALTLLLLLGKPVSGPCNRTIPGRIALTTDTPAKRDFRHTGIIFQAAITRTVLVASIVLPLHSGWCTFRDVSDSEPTANDWYTLCPEHTYLRELRLEQLKENRKDADT